MDGPNALIKGPSPNATSISKGPLKIQACLQVLNNVLWYSSSSVLLILFQLARTRRSMWYFNIGLRGDIAVVAVVIISCVPINEFVTSNEMSRICVQRGVHVFVMTGPNEMCLCPVTVLRGPITLGLKFWSQSNFGPRKGPTNECLWSARANQITALFADTMIQICN